MFDVKEKEENDKLANDNKNPVLLRSLAHIHLSSDDVHIICKKKWNLPVNCVAMEHGSNLLVIFEQSSLKPLD